MAKPKRSSAETEALESPNLFRFNLAGLLAFSLCLMAGTALVSSRLFSARPKEISFVADNIPDPDNQDKSTFTHKGPWGEMLVQNIKLERPVEYVVGEVRAVKPAVWRFSGMNLAQVQAALKAGGLTAEQIAAVLATGQPETQGNTTSLTPSSKFLLSLSSEQRQELYASFYGNGVYMLADYPYIFPKDSIETIYEDERLNPDDVALLKQLIFRSGNSTHLVDFPTLMLNIPTDERRVAMARALSRQSAVLARLCIRPDSDIDKIAGYWGHMDNVRFTNLRPLLEGLKALPNGGTISFAYLLPPFARERLYTYPLPPEQGEPNRDCHWSTFNFSSAEPDNRFNDPSFAVQQIQANYYKIDQANLYGDVILFMNDKQEIKHSAVFIADDLAFTKYGNSHTQPWMFVRISDMQEHYPGLKLYYMRKKTH
jgi:hypothetical protein